MILLLLSSAWASSLDNLEVGGPFGTPSATDATSIWWNPAGMAADAGTRLALEVAPTFATVQFDRVDPHGRGGSDSYQLAGAIPFAGVVSDLGVDGLGVGGGIAIPFVRGGAETPNPGPGRYSMRDGSIQAAHAILGAAWRPHDKISVGAALHLVQSSWVAQIDTETLTGLAHEIEQAGGDPDYTDDQIEDPDYSATLDFDHLSDVATSFSGGVRVMPSETVALSLSYVHGYRVENRGDVSLAFQCPPQEDTLGRFGAESLGLCYSTVQAQAQVAYRLPSRLSLGAALEPRPGTVVEVLGGWIGWGAHDDFEVTVSKAEIESTRARQSIESERLQARANRDTFWGGVDAKHEVTDSLLVGGRVLYDRSAVPDVALAPNNYDASAVMITGLFGFKPHERVQIAASVTQHLLATREITDSGFGVTLDEDAAAEDRWFYPQMNGTYRGSITRVGIGVRGQLGARTDDQ